MPLPVFNIVLYLLIIVFALAGMCVSATVFYQMFTRWTTVQRHCTGFLLLFNSYLPLFIVGPLFTDLSVQSIYGYFHPESSFDGFRCRLKAYLMYIQGCVYFYSFLLQSIYRFCRIVYHNKPELHALDLYKKASIFLWINALVQLLPCLWLRYIDYMPAEHHCQFRLFDLSGSLIGLSILFLVPHLLTLMCYIATLSYVRKRSTVLIGINRRLRFRRDLVVFRRIVLLLSVVIFVAMPHMILPIIFDLFGTLPSWATAFEWLTTAAILQIFISPNFKRLFVEKKTSREVASLRAEFVHQPVSRSRPLQ